MHNCTCKIYVNFTFTIYTFDKENKFLVIYIIKILFIINLKKNVIFFFHYSKVIKFNLVFIENGSVLRK